ncbi:MAG: archaemetzincin [Myxococcota bacterium]
MRTEQQRRRWGRLALWLFPWVLTAVFAAGMHLSRDEPEPEDPWKIVPMIPQHELVVRKFDEAMGSLEHLSPKEQRAFEYTNHFAPVPIARPDDWLSFHPEPGQSVYAYVQSRPNRPDPPNDQIYILPLGPLPAERGPTVEELAQYGQAFFNREVVVLDTRSVESLDVPTREQGGVRQLDAGAVLDVLRTELPRDAYCLIAVTFEDLYPNEKYNYVFGLARLHQRVGVFSFARYHPAFFGERFGIDRRLVVRRALKVMSHEIGHMFGLEHCIYLHCNMNGVNHLAELDRAPMHLCPVCLRKLHLMLGFSPPRRYGALSEIYERLGLDSEADWAVQRQVFLERGG